MVVIPKKSTQPHFYPSRIDLPLEIRQQVVLTLNMTLATSIDLKTQIKQAHWSVKGKEFYLLHQLFDELAGEIEDFVDMVAERITALSAVPHGTARAAGAASLLPEYPLDIVEGVEHIQALAERYARYARHVRESIASTDSIGDADTADLYTEISRTADLRLWFLEAHLINKADLV